MTAMMAAVLVLPPGHSREDVDRHRTPIFGSKEDRSTVGWGAYLSDGWIKLSSSPVGFDLLILQFASTAYHRDHEDVLQRLEEFVTTGRALGAHFGYLTRYEYQYQDDGWMEKEVLIPLLCNEYEHLAGHPFVKILIEPHYEHPGEDTSRPDTNGPRNAP